MRTFAIICSAVIGVAVLCSPIIAQAKTAKECRKEWQANKAENQAKKITESAYVKECTAGGATTQPAVAKPTKKTEPKTAPAPAAPKTETKMAPAPAAAACKMAPARSKHHLLRQVPISTRPKRRPRRDVARAR